MKSFKTFLAGFVALCATVLAHPSGARAGENTPQTVPVRLSGVWVLDRQASDDAREKMREIRQDRGAPTPPGSPGGGRMSGPGDRRGPGGGPPPGAMAGPDPREAMKALFEPAETIRITQTPAEIEVDEVDGRLRRFHPNGRAYKTDNGLAETTAEWKDGVLHVQITRDRGPKVVETWAVSSDGRRLTVQVQQEGRRTPEITLKRVYTRSEDEAPEPAAR
jgi:hypothetical protein